MTKQQIYESILVRLTGLYYSPGICFEDSLVNMDKAKALTKSNKLEKRIPNKKSGAGAALSRNYESPQRIYLWGLI